MVHYELFVKRPCKIWAPYVGHRIEKSIAPKSKYVDTPKPDLTICLGDTEERKTQAASIFP
jgi:hypothetical protein